MAGKKDQVLKKRIMPGLKNKKKNSKCPKIIKQKYSGAERQVAARTKIIKQKYSGVVTYGTLQRPKIGQVTF